VSVAPRQDLLTNVVGNGAEASTLSNSKRILSKMPVSASSESYKKTLGSVTLRFDIETLINASFVTSMAVLLSDAEAEFTRAGKQRGTCLESDNSASQNAEADE
jgi:hypothetical protein